MKAGLPAVLDACPRVRTLRLRGGGSTSLEPIASLRCLEDLELEAPRAAALPDLSHLALRRLALRRAQLGSLDLAALRTLETLDADVDGTLGALPSSLRSLALRTVQRPDAVLSSLPRLESLELEWEEPTDEALALSSMPALRSLRATGEGPLEAPATSLEVLEALDAPAWLASQERLTRLSISPLAGVTRALEVALALPSLGSLSFAGWGESFVVPAGLATRTRLREVRIVGRHASPMQALERIAEIPALEVLEVPSGATTLPSSLTERPLRALHYRVPRPQDAPPLDLAQAFALLASTPLRELVLDGLGTLPDAIASLTTLETLRFGPHTAPRLPDAIHALASLRLVVMGAQLTAPERKRVLRLLPQAALRERR